MEYITTHLVSLPNVALYMIFGALAGAIGGLLGSVLSRIFKKEALTGLVAMVCVIVSVQVLNQILPDLKSDSTSDAVMEELKKQKIFTAIFRFHPEAEAELRSKMTSVVSGTSSEQAFYEAQAASAEVVSKYIERHLATASDQATYDLLKRNAFVMAGFQDRPNLCVSYYLGRPNFSREDLTPEFIAEESNVKANVVESSGLNPSPTLEAAGIDEIVEVIAKEYQRRGYDLQGLTKIEQVASLPPAEGCKIALDFSRALASLDMKQASHVFKSLLYIANQ